MTKFKGANIHKGNLEDKKKEFDGLFPLSGSSKRIIKDMSKGVLIPTEMPKIELMTDTIEYKIEEYAKSLVKHKVYTTIGRARVESKR